MTNHCYLEGSHQTTYPKVSRAPRLYTTVHKCVLCTNMLQFPQALIVLIITVGDAAV